MKQFIRLLRTVFITILICWAWFFIYSQRQEQPQVDRVQYLYNFYQTSWYNFQREYERDIEELQRLKQADLDSLSYKETILFYRDGTYDTWISETMLKRFSMIDEAIWQAQSWIKKISDPDYTIIAKDSKQEVNKLNFINLLK